MHPEREVPWRRSLTVRLFGLVAVVAVVSVAATAWLTVHTTAVGIQQEQGESLRADARIADVLTSYAATHPSWSAAGPVVRRLAQSTGHRITITGTDGGVLIDSSTSHAQLPSRASTTIDPLDVGPEPDDTPDASTCSPNVSCPVAPASYLGDPPGDAPISPDAVGPFALTTTERASSRASAQQLADCLTASTGTDERVVESPSGRSSITPAPEQAAPSQAVPRQCTSSALDQPLPSEVKPLRQLQSSVAGCLERRHSPAVTLDPDLGWRQTRARTASSDRAVEACLLSARRAQLAPYVAPRALLYVSDPRTHATTILDLSTSNRLRIAEVALLVMVGSLLFVAAAGRRLVRPLGALAQAAHQMRGGDLSARADVRARNEIGSVAQAFNTMAERRQSAEALRRAQVSDVAHELRNPLSTIRASLEAAQDGLVPTDQGLVASLLEETLLLQHVVEDLRDLAAADAGELRLTLAPVPVDELCEHVVAASQVEARAAGVSLQTTSTGSPVVLGDEHRLRQALGNLINNALRHTPRGGHVTVNAADLEGGVEIVVADTGEGISAGDLEHVFERFWRADLSRTRASGGSGLGLAIVRQLAEAHRGTATASSEIGVGSRFVLHLPSATS